jgi:hypothetical protein
MVGEPPRFGSWGIAESRATSWKGFTMRNNVTASVFGEIVLFLTLDLATADEPPKPSPRPSMIYSP